MDYAQLFTDAQNAGAEAQQAGLPRECPSEYAESTIVEGNVNAAYFWYLGYDTAANAQVRTTPQPQQPQKSNKKK